MHSRRHLRFAPVLALTALTAIVGCDDSTDDAADDGEITNRCAMEDRAEEYAVGMEKHGENVMVRFISADPAPPARGDNVWTLAVMSHEGVPMDDVAVDSATWMPDHQHGSPISEEVTPMGDGQYVLDPVNLFMAGYWEITIELELPDGEIDDVVFPFCVE